MWTVIAQAVIATARYWNKRASSEPPQPVSPKVADRQNNGNAPNSNADVTRKSKPVCPECKTEYEEGVLFCKKDGQKLIV